MLISVSIAINIIITIGIIHKKVIIVIYFRFIYIIITTSCRYCRQCYTRMLYTTLRASRFACYRIVQHTIHMHTYRIVSYNISYTYAAATVSNRITAVVNISTAQYLNHTRISQPKRQILFS